MGSTSIVVAISLYVNHPQPTKHAAPIQVVIVSWICVGPAWKTERTALVKELPVWEYNYALDESKLHPGGEMKRDEA